MKEFELKITPRSKEEITNFKNFQTYNTFSFKANTGKIVFLNASYPGRHIYQPYYVVDTTGYPLRYKVGDESIHPMLSLQELAYDDIIVFYTQDDIDFKNNLKKQKAAAAAIVQPNP